MKDQHNVFISHYHEDEDCISKMRALLGDDYVFRNSSVTSDKFNQANNTDYIKGLLRERITWAKTIICLIGANTHNSSWVDYEIEYAARQGKEIIGVFTNGAKDSDIPEALEKYASSIVCWRREKIIDALNCKYSFENTDGTIRIVGKTNRSTC